MIKSIKRILKRINLSVIHKRIESGRIVYFESPLEELAFKYIPDKPGRADETGKYFAKYYGQEEYEINSDSSSVFLAVNEGVLISKYRYNRYHLIEGTCWNRETKIPVTYRSVGT